MAGREVTVYLLAVLVRKSCHVFFSLKFYTLLLKTKDLSYLKVLSFLIKGLLRTTFARRYFAKMSRCLIVYLTVGQSCRSQYNMVVDRQVKGKVCQSKTFLVHIFRLLNEISIELRSHGIIHTSDSKLTLLVI